LGGSRESGGAHSAAGGVDEKEGAVGERHAAKRGLRGEGQDGGDRKSTGEQEGGCACGPHQGDLDSIVRSETSDPNAVTGLAAGRFSEQWRPRGDSEAHSASGAEDAAGKGKESASGVTVTTTGVTKVAGLPVVRGGLRACELEAAVAVGQVRVERARRRSSCGRVDGGGGGELRRRV
jgi:hypothetical protein